MEGPWGTMIQTSKTKSVTISLLKHLNGNPLGTTTTLVDHWLMYEVLLVVDQNRLLMASSRTSSTSSSSRSWSPTSTGAGTMSSSSIYSILFLRVVPRPNASVRNNVRSLKSKTAFNRPRAHRRESRFTPPYFADHAQRTLSMTTPRPPIPYKTVKVDARFF